MPTRKPRCDPAGDVSHWEAAEEVLSERRALSVRSALAVEAFFCSSSISTVTSSLHSAPAHQLSSCCKTSRS